MVCSIAREHYKQLVHIPVLADDINYSVDKLNCNDYSMLFC